MNRWYPVLLLVCSNLFMTYAWYGHLRDQTSRPLFLVILTSWSVAFLEYCFQVPANRLGHQVYSLAQLKVLQELIALGVFALFSVTYMREHLSWNFLGAALCLTGAAFFMFRGVS